MHQYLAFTVTDSLSKLKSIYHRVSDIKNAAAVLDWDQETYMPPGSGNARAHQSTTLETLAHEIATSNELGDLLHSLHDYALEQPEHSNDRRLIEVGLEDYEKNSKLSPELVGKIAGAVSRAKDAWRDARAENNFKAFAPHLTDLIELNREKAEAFGYSEHLYDALLDEYEPGLTAGRLDSIFDPLRSELVSLVDTIADAPEVDTSILRRTYPHQQQWDFGVDIITSFGYDFNRGRQDLSAHPFTINFSIDDVRITTRIDENFFNPGFFGTLHEAGHGLYEQGIDHSLARLPLARGTSLGIHESQSRFWENLVGRSRPFWVGHFDKLRSYFPGLPASATPESFYRAVNAVNRSFIRVEADELTYNLHIMLRYELEKSIFEGTVAVDDLPDAWNQKMHDYLELTPPSNDKGVLQDIHWALGAFGYFPTYAIGNLMSTQLYDALKKDIPGTEELIEKGSFDDILDWMKQKIHRHGRKMTAEDLMISATGSSLDSSSWLRYARTKYADIYGL
ncbi:MAG: carboxypeptidase M32 [Rhodothermales bacterium]|nr:carboxypeptidase M32 [Rhodothermales bacterium]